MNYNDLKILHINCNYAGTKLHQNMIKYLDDLGIENKVFCPINNNDKNICVEPNNNVIFSNCFNTLDRFFFFKKQKKIISSIENNINIKEFKCIHAYTLFTDGNCAYELSEKYKIPYVIAIRATDIEFYKYRINLRKKGLKILEKASKIFFLSEKIKHIFLEKYVPNELIQEIKNKIEVIPNGIDEFWIRNRYYNKNIQEKINKIRNKRVNIITVSQIIRRKNIPNLQSAIDRMVKEGWSVNLKVIGKNVDKSLTKKIIKHKYTNYINFVNKEELIKYYRDSDLFVLPSKGETFGLVYAEAMTQGLPVIYSKNEGFDGQFEDGLIGNSVECQNVEDIKNKIILAFKEYENLYNNIKTVNSKFNWKDITNQYALVYKEIVQ